MFLVLWCDLWLPVRLQDEWISPWNLIWNTFLEHGCEAFRTWWHCRALRERLHFFMQAGFLDVVVLLKYKYEKSWMWLYKYTYLYIMFVCEVLSASKVLHLFYKADCFINLLSLSWEFSVLPSSCHLFCLSFLHQNPTWWADIAGARILSGA